jgi:hypothetical protein
MVKRLLLVVAVALCLGSVAEAASPWVTLTNTTTCTSVGTSSTQVLAANASRVRWAIWTTSGAATIYFDDRGATATDADSPLDDGTWYREDYAPTTSAVNAIAKTGTVWVCTKEAAQ